MPRRIVGLTSALVLASIVVQACTTQTYLGRGFDDDAAIGPPSFTNADGGEGGASIAEDASRDMCPSDKCKAPYGTCSTSTYLCDVDLSSDPDNCGSCGNQCPREGWRNELFHAKWICVQGTCQMSCSSTHYADCNGRIEDGCETIMATNQDCAACGHACPDGTICADGVCKGCGPTETNCSGACVDLESDDSNCGACGEWCPSFPPDEPFPPPNMLYGCSAGSCGNLKCDFSWADCNADAEDGCETWLPDDPNNCGQCNKKCAASEICVGGKCQCNPGPSGCDCLPDFESNLRNCGGCGVICSERPNSTPTCEFGRCGSNCKAGYGDCNRDLTDGCEVNLSKDPQNCGSCGTACETGQACIDGVCATEPCPPGVTH